MAGVCPSSIQACGLRVTLLDSQGNVANQANNFYVTNKLITIGTAPDIEEGTDITMKSGCDCIIASYKGADLLKRFTFTLNLGAIEPALLSLLTGGSVILDGSDPIGMDWPIQVECADEPPPYVALEVWSVAWTGGGPDPTWPYIHWIWPMSRWQIADAELGSADFFRPSLTGFSLQNGLWGHGPYNDDPGEVVGELGSFWFTDTAPPTAFCGYQSVTPSS
jgi:hypothetical protein